MYIHRHIYRYIHAEIFIHTSTYTNTFVVNMFLTKKYERTYATTRLVTGDSSTVVRLH